MLMGSTFNIDVTSDKLLIILGDTLVHDNITNHLGTDFIGWHQVNDYKRWCLLKGDEWVDCFVDKPNEDPGTRKAVIGVYYFTNIRLLCKSLEYIIQEKDIRIKNEYQLSSAMDEYMKVQKFKAVEFTQWFDCGDLETYTKTRKNISRCFNIVSVTDENTIVKKSETQGGKIAKEAMWYLNIPNRLRVYTPQLIDYNLSKGSEQYELEYVNFSPLHELFVYEMPHLSDWKKIIDNIFNMVSKFKTYSNKAMFNVNTHAEDIFVNKLVERFEEIKKTPELAKFICSDSFTVNGNAFPGIKKIMPQVVEYMKMISSKSLYNWQIIHGDLFFGNMLYDINSDTLKIVDPRGNFGVDGIYGDVRYDLAKLAHSIVGKYDFVVNGLYTIYSQSDSHIEFQIYESKQKHDELVDLFKAKLEQEGFNETEIMMITGTLFLSLIPLHSENPTNQKIFYAIALEILNDTIKRLPNKELE
jgi:thiamine kinase-like enzyme